MIRVSVNEDKLDVYFQERKVISHSAKKPFATAYLIEKKYKSSRGKFKVKEEVVKTIPLSDFLVTGSDSCYEIRFYFGGVSLSTKLTVENNAMRVTFSGNEEYSYCFNLCAKEDEAIFGGGEQYRKLNLKGEKVVNFVTEHIKFKVILQKVFLRFIKYKEKEHKDIGSYSPMSTFVSSDHYAVRFDVDSDGYADFSKPNNSYFLYNECPRSMLYVVEDTFANIGKRLNYDIPNNEYLPSWAYDGMILGIQGGIDIVKKKAYDMIEKGAKICGVWCQDWSGKKITALGSQVYWNWQADNILYPNLAENIVELKSKGVRFLAYINPYLVKDSYYYDYCKSKGYLILNKQGEVYLIKSTTFFAGMIDLTNDEAVKFLKETLIKKNMLDLGIDGYMADFGEYLPVDCVLHNGNPSVLHNYWPTLWAKINREAITEYGNKDVFFFTRSGYNGAQSYTTLMWNGDQHTDFTCDYGLPCVMPATFSLGFSGMTVAHSDIGGFFGFGKLKRNEELFIRWMEMSTFSPLMRSHEGIRPQDNAQFDKEVTQYTVRFTRIHKQLKPYIQKQFDLANQGIPLMRPDFYDANDFNEHKDQYSYMFGSDMFVCPVVSQNVNERKVYLPKGNWKQLFTNIEFNQGEYTLSAKLGEPLVFYKQDSEFKDIFEKIKLEEKQ